MKERNEVIACFALFKLNTTIKSGVVRVFVHSFRFYFALPCHSLQIKAKKNENKKNEPEKTRHSIIGTGPRYQGDKNVVVIVLLAYL